MIYCIIILFSGCMGGTPEITPFEIQHFNDSISEARIDSAYPSIRSNCDSLMVYLVPRMVDSFLKDSVLLLTFFDTGNLYRSLDKKAEKIVRQLEADCETSLLKETYRRARLRQKLKPVQHKR